MAGSIRTENGTLLRRYELSYSEENATGRSRLDSIKPYGADGSKAAEAVCFSYLEGPDDFTTVLWEQRPAFFGPAEQSKQLLTGDINGGGRTDIA